MKQIIPLVSPNKPNHNKRETVLLIVILILLLIGIGAGLLLTLQPKPISIQKKAQEMPNSNTNTLICPADGATCSWDSQTGGVTYSYEIIDQTVGATVKTGTTPDTKVSFTPIINHAYKCTIKAINQCGEGPSSSTVNTCFQVGTPTTTEVPTDTPTPTNEISPTTIQGFIPTDTPTPTLEIVVNSTSTPTPTPTVSVITQISTTETPTPTLSPTPRPPTSGSNTGILFMVVSTVILVSLMVVF